MASADFGLSSASTGSPATWPAAYGNVTTLIGNGTSTTLTGSNTGSIFMITANGNGTVNDGLGTTTFQGAFSLAGGTTADSFNFSGGGTLAGSLNGGTGANTLDLSAVAGAANFTLAGADAGTASPVGGWLVERRHPGRQRHDLDAHRSRPDRDLVRHGQQRRHRGRQHGHHRVLRQRRASSAAAPQMRSSSAPASPSPRSTAAAAAIRSAPPRTHLRT